jgi:amidase
LNLNEYSNYDAIGLADLVRRKEVKPSELADLSLSVAHFFLDYDVLLTPTTTIPPTPLGTYDANYSHLDALGWMRQLLSFAAFTAPFNMTGQPAMSLPLHKHRGFPIGVQLVGRSGDEATLFRLAGQLEQAIPWIDRRPPLSL